jgi:hypothetical protein
MWRWKVLDRRGLGWLFVRRVVALVEKSGLSVKRGADWRGGLWLEVSKISQGSAVMRW